MRLAILGSPGSWYFRDLARAGGDRHEIRAVSFAGVYSSVRDGEIGVASGNDCLDAFDAVLVRTMPPGSLEQVVFRMDALASLESRGVLVVNPPKAIEAAVDKYLTLTRLCRAGLPVPATLACQGIQEAMDALDALGGDVVVKPIFGSEGRGIFRLTDRDLAERAFKTLVRLNAIVYVQRFIHHSGQDVRVLVIGRRLLAIKRRHPTDWRTNIQRGAVAEPVELCEEHVQLARRAADAVGATLAGVDILSDSQGRNYVVEVNAVPGWRGAARTLGVDVAGMVLDHVEGLLRDR